MVKRGINLSAVYIAFPILMILSSIGQLVGVGASSYTSRMLGNKRNGLATVVGQCCSIIYLLKYYLSKKSFVKMDINLVSKNFKDDKAIYIEIFKIGTPLFVMQFLYSVAFSLLNNSALPYGDAAVAAMGISLIIYMIPLYIIMGFIQGFQPFAAYNFGAKLYGRLNKAIKFSAKTLIIIGFIFMLVIQVMPHIFVGMFTKDPTVAAYAINTLTSISLMLPIIPILFLVTSLFQALGKVKQSAALSLSRQGILLIPLAATLPKLFETMGDKLSLLTNLMRFDMPKGLYGIILAQPISDGLTVLLALILGIGVIKELKQLENQNNKEYDTSKKYAYNR